MNFNFNIGKVFLPTAAVLFIVGLVLIGMDLPFLGVASFSIAIFLGILPFCPKNTHKMTLFS